MHSLVEVWKYLLEPPFSWVMGAMIVALLGLGALALMASRRPARRLKLLDASLGMAGLFWLTLSLFATACLFQLHDPHRFDYLVLGLSATTLLFTLGAVVMALPLARHYQFKNRHRLVERVLGAEAAKAVPTRVEAQNRSLAHRLGIAPPKLFVMEEGTPKCLALGGERGAVLLSRGLLELLTPSELESALAHELAHLHLAHDTRQRFWALFSRCLFLDPIARIATAAACREREFEADSLASDLTGRPLDLATALLKLARYKPPAALRTEARARLASLLGGGVPRTHPFLRERVERLRHRTAVS